MAKLYTCDQCLSGIYPNLTKAFVAFSDTMGSKGGVVPRFSIHPWSDRIAVSNQARHLCSASCAQLELLGWSFQQGAQERPAVEEPAPALVAPLPAQEQPTAEKDYPF